MEFYKVKITRKGTKPPIWRRCLVPADITFAQMAVVLEEILEYETSSLYEFILLFILKKEALTSLLSIIYNIWFVNFDGPSSIVI